MTLQSFSESLKETEPLPSISDYLKALWYDTKGNWKKAHQIIQDIDDEKASWIHAYLHRKEGDLFNAKYWYNKAGKSVPSFNRYGAGTDRKLFFSIICFSIIIICLQT